MKNKTCSLVCVLFVVVSAAAMAATTPMEMEKLCKQRIDAIGEDNFTLFVGGGTLEMLKSNKRTFDTLVKTMQPAVLSGYKLTYLGSGNEKGHQLYHWRVKFKNTAKPYTATLVMRDTKVAGFWLE